MDGNNRKSNHDRQASQADGKRKKLSLNMLSSSECNWTVSDAIRELIYNWLVVFFHF
jgi:hypothetical protein